MTTPASVPLTDRRYRRDNPCRVVAVHERPDDGGRRWDRALEILEAAAAKDNAA